MIQYLIRLLTRQVFKHKTTSLIILGLVVGFFFYRTIFSGLLPIPADTIVGLYHPFRDLYAQQFPNGIPFKNFLITDPVRQQYPWRELAIDLLKRGELPLWNPYSFAGTPLLGNLQSAGLYPLNLLYLILPFSAAWTIQVMLQPLLAAIFMLLYLRQLRLHKISSFLGAVAFAFSGFFIAWLEWNTILHTVLWLPLILLSIEKMINVINVNEEKFEILLWSGIFVFSLSSSFLAGHLQVFFYLSITVLLYIASSIYKQNNKLRLSLFFIFHFSFFILLTFHQWFPTARFILNSGRGMHSVNWQHEGWFIPWRHLIQFVAPDFFGNPTTLNYWGIWNYGEFVGYIGVIPLILALYALFFHRYKKTTFFGGLAFVALLFAIPNPIARIPFELNVPLFSTSQPTRLLFIVDFSLAILAALGMDYLFKRFISTSPAGKIRKPIKQALVPFVLTGLVLGGLWGFTEYGTELMHGLVEGENLAVAQRNLILPTLLWVAAFVTTLTYILSFYNKIPVIRDSSKLRKVILLITICGLLITTVFDLFRFGYKFTPFTKQEYLFPQTDTIEFLQNKQAENAEPFRIMSVDKRVLPPNFSVIYRLQDVSGYDPLYLREYGELAAAWNRNRPDISPIDFNRIITPQNYESRIADLLNVRYILSLDELSSGKLTKVYEEGQTKVYENKLAYPRAFLVENVILAKDKQDMVEKLFDEELNLSKTAVVYEMLDVYEEPLMDGEKVKIVTYSENAIIVETNTAGKRLLILTDNYYPNWRAYVYPEGTRKADGEDTEIHRVNYNLRGVVIPEGSNKVLFKISWM